MRGNPWAGSTWFMVLMVIIILFVIAIGISHVLVDVNQVCHSIPHCKVRY